MRYIISHFNYVTVYFFILAFFVGFAILSKVILKPYVQKWWHGHDNNDQIAFYLSAVGVFYGITLGLFAAGVYQNYDDAEEKVHEETSSIAALYRGAIELPPPHNKIIANYIKSYSQYVIDTAWSSGKSENKIHRTTFYVNLIQKELYRIEPSSERESIIMTECIEQFNHFVELRRMRLQSIGSVMPPIIWFVIITGGLLIILMCSLFNIPSQKLHNTMNIIMSISIASLIYLIAMLNNPFIGDLGIKPDGLKDVMELMEELK